MLRVALQLHRAPGQLIDCDEHAARVRAVMRTNRMNHLPRARMRFRQSGMKAHELILEQSPTPHRLIPLYASARTQSTWLTTSTLQATSKPSLTEASPS